MYTNICHGKKCVVSITRDYLISGLGCLSDYIRAVQQVVLVRVSGHVFN